MRPTSSSMARSLLEHVGQVPNLFVARTFSKAYGMAGLAWACWRARRSRCRPAARLLAVQREWRRAGLPAGSAGGSGIRSPICGGSSVEPESLEKNFASLGIPFWPSQANFVLARIGPSHADFVRSMRRAAFWFATGRAIRVAMAACASPLAGGSTRTAAGRTARDAERDWLVRERSSRHEKSYASSARRRKPQIRAVLDHRWTRPVRGVHRHPLLRSHAGAVCPSWRLRS